MTPQRRALLEELEAYGRKHDAARADRRERLRLDQTAGVLAIAAT